jgi:hypothetical protein
MGRPEEAPVGDEQAHDNLARDEDDHDLLTFSESAIRLRTEIARTEEALRESRDPERRAALEGRLSALADALDRNTRQADVSPGERGFLDYAPPRRDGTEEEGRLPRTEPRCGLSPARPGHSRPPQLRLSSR